MKRILLFLACLMLLILPAAAENSGYAGVWIENEGCGTLTLLDDGSAVMEYSDGAVTATTWSLTDDGCRFGEGMWYNSPLELLDDNTLSVSGGWMVFTREGFQPSTDPTLLLDAVPVGEEGEAFCGAWQLDAILIDGESYSPALFGMSIQLTLTNDGLATIVTDDGTDYCTWCVSGPALLIDGDMFLPDEEGRLALTADGASMVFTRMAESPVSGFIATDAPEEDFIGIWVLDSVVTDDGTVSAALTGETRYILFQPYWEGFHITGSELSCFDWEYADGRMITDDAELFIDAQGRLILPDPAVTMVFVAPPDADPAEFVGAWELTEVLMEGESHSPAELEMSMRLDLAADGTLTSYSPAMETSTWSVSGPGALADDVLLIPDGQGRLILPDSYLTMVFTPAESSEPTGVPLTPVGEEGSAFLGPWTLEAIVMDGESFSPALFGMAMTLTFSEDGSVAIVDGGDATTGPWHIENGAAVVDGQALAINADGKLVMEDEEAAMIFVRGGIAPGEAPSEEEQWAALAGLMGGAADADWADAPAGLPGSMQPFVGEWYMVYCHTGGLTGDLRTMGVTGCLTLDADGFGYLIGVADEFADWYEDEGVIRFGESGMPMYLLGGEADGVGPFLQYGTEAGGYMIFHQDEAAVWTPGLYPLQGAAPAVTDTPAASGAPATSSGSAIRMEVRYVCKTYTSAGFTMDAATLGAEYALLFHEGGTVDFTVAGFNAAGLPCSVNADGQYAIDYYGSPILCIPTDAGVDLDYFGAMTLHFVPAP